MATLSMDHKMKKYFLKDEAATLYFGKVIADVLPQQCVIYLQGELGAGKTTLVRGILRALGYKGAVKSPTYTLVEPYELERKQIYHFDLYRLIDAEELEFVGIRDYQNGSVLLIEWPDRGGEYVPTADITVTLEPEGNGRSILLLANSDIGVRLLDMLFFSPI